MPAAIVIVKHKQQQPEEKLQAKQQQFNINLCAPLPCSGVDVNAAAKRNTSNAADVDVAATEAAAELTAWRGRSRRRQLRSAKAASTLRTVIIIMALVFSIMQQQQQQLQQQQQQWPFYNGKYAPFILGKHTIHFISLPL